MLASQSKENVQVMHRTFHSSSDNLGNVEQIPKMRVDYSLEFFNQMIALVTNALGKLVNE